EGDQQPDEPIDPARQSADGHGDEEPEDHGDEGADAGGDERVDETAEQDGQSLSGEFPIPPQSPPPWPGEGFLARAAPSPAAECEARRSLRGPCSRAARRACRRSVLEVGRVRPRRAVAVRSRKVMNSWSSQAMTK